MTTIEYAILSLCVFLAVLAVAKCLIDINELDKRIDVLEKREQMKQLEAQREKAYIETKNLFKEW